MLSTRVRTLPGRTAAHAWRTALFSSATVEGVHPCLGSRLTFDPKHAQLGSCLDSELASPWPQHAIGPKRLPSHVLYGAGLCLGRTQSYVQTLLSPMATFDSSWSGCTNAGSWLHPPRPAHSSPWWIAPHTMTDGPRFPSFGLTQASISLSPCLRHTRIRRSLWCRENRDSSLKIQCLHCLRSHTLCLLPPLTAASHVLQSEHRTSGWTPRPISGGQKPSPNGSNWHPPPKSADHLHSQTRSQDEAVRSDHSEQLTVFPWRGDFHRNLHASSDVVGQSLGCVAKFCSCILETPPASWLLLAENCHLPTTWQFAAVFAWANFVYPLEVQRNINSFYRNPTLHKSIKVIMARQLSLQVTTPELTFSFSWVSAVQRQYWLCLPIQFGYVKDRWNQQYFVPQLNIRPETINTDQMRTCHLVVVIL